MANTFLTPTAVTREALRVLRQKLNFIGSINRAYDASFGQTGAKIGSTLKIRLPNQFTVRTGATRSNQDVVEDSVTLSVATIKGVDFSYTSEDWTLSLDDFSSRILNPAMSQLAASIESDVLTNVTKDVYNIIDGDAAALAFNHIALGRQRLVEELAPDGDRYGLLSPAHTTKFVDAVKGLFHDSQAIKQQYREGMIGRTSGFDFMESTFVSDFTTGTAAKTTGYLSNGATQSGATITVDTGTTTFLAGDIITFAGVFRVHPETKVSSGVLQQFVVTANSGASATSLSISPAVVATGAKQNVSNTIADNSAIVKVGAGASELLNSSLMYHKDAFTFVTADLVLPKGTHMASREVMDGISMRLVSDFQISDGSFPCRFDVLYGYKTIRPGHAVRLHADG